jgi:hypothetical protein
MQISESYSVFDRAFSNINKAEIQQNALRLFIISFNPTYMFRPEPAIFRVGVIKYQVKLFKNSVIKVKMESQVFSKKS